MSFPPTGNCARPIIIWRSPSLTNRAGSGRQSIFSFARSPRRGATTSPSFFPAPSSDGSVGIKAVKEAGGIILVQDPDEAEYGSMPRSAVATGLADFVLPIREIAARLPELIRNRPSPPSDDLTETDGEAMQRILSHLRVRSGHDFSSYKKSTIRRRIGEECRCNAPRQCRTISGICGKVLRRRRRCSLIFSYRLRCSFAIQERSRG